MGVLKQIKPLPENVTLSQIIQSIPKEAFEKDTVKAVRSIIITLLSTAFGVFVIAVCPVWFLPFAWFYTGTAATGLFVLGHDCGHRSLIKSVFWNDVIGTATFLPLLLELDTAWHPVTEKYYSESNYWYRLTHHLTRGPLWFIGSVGHWIIEHLDLSRFKGDDLVKVKGSTKALNIFSVIFFPLMFYFFGVWGIVKFWLVPWLGFHFWMSTFTLIHHTAPHIPFLPAAKWRDAVASLQYTVHCKYPAWVDFLCHDISVHIPHHVTTAIPHYRLRLAYDSLKKNWGPYMQECEFNTELVWDIISNCQIHDEDSRLYKTFASMLKSAGIIKANNDAVKQE